MARMTGLFKNALTAFLLLVAAVVTASADGFVARRGLNFSQWETWPAQAEWGNPEKVTPFPEWRKTVTQADMERLKAAGMDFMRMPVDPRVFMALEAKALRTQLLEEVHQAVRFVTGNGLKVIVDLHAIPAEGALGVETLVKDDAAFERYLAVVSDIAHIVADEPADRVALGLLNEPIIACQGGKGWLQRLKRLHETARTAAPKTPLVLTGGCWADAESLAKLDPKTIGDDNVIWEFHSYAPFLLSHQGATWTGDFAQYVTGLRYPLHAMPSDELDGAVSAIKARFAENLSKRTARGHSSYLDELTAEIATEKKLTQVMAKPMDIAAAWADRHGIPRSQLLLGEFGMIRQEYGNPYVVPPAERAAYYRDVIALAEERGIGWAMWSYSGAFGIVEEFEGRRAEPDVLDMVGGLGGLIRY